MSELAGRLGVSFYNAVDVAQMEYFSGLQLKRRAPESFTTVSRQ